MFEIFHIFPQGSLSSSVVTTALIGILVTAFFNLRLGWVLSGLVIPGYLVPLLLVKPWCGVTVIIEGIVTYIAVLIFAEYMPRLGLWHSVFGRDRFFAILLVSVIVKLVSYVWVLPAIGNLINNTFHVTFQYEVNLHSFGLIVVALIANQFWKPGFFRGIIPLFVNVFVTFLIVRYLLMEYTNFSISNLSYMYEDIAFSMLAGPKAYIVLLSSAFIASRMNLYYGWEFNGIIIPSLIALEWYQPEKIMFTVIETLVILFAGRLILSTPLFRRTTVEGARKIMLFFGISYTYKFMLAYLFLFLWPEKKITDFYGLGYLLPALIAMKIDQKDMVIKVTRAILQTSLMAVIFSSIVGYSLTYLPNPFPILTGLVSNKGIDIKEPVRPDTGLMDFIKSEKVRLYKDASVPTPLPVEYEAFVEGIRMVSEYIKDKDPVLLKKAQNALEIAHYHIIIVEDKYLVLLEKDPQVGRGIYVFNMGKSVGLTIEVPAPLNEWGSVEAGVMMFREFNARALAIASQGGNEIITDTVNVPAKQSAFLQGFHRQVARANVLQVRGYTSSTVRRLSGARREAGEIDLPALESTLWVTSKLPHGMDLAMLKGFIGSFRIEWGVSPLKNGLRDITGSGFSELFLNRKDLIKLLYKPIFQEHELPLDVNEQSILGYLQDWLLKGKVKVAMIGTNLYVRPMIEELLFFDKEILTPILNLTLNEYRSGQLTEAGLSELSIISSSASVMGYEIIRYRHKITDQDFLILVESESAERSKYWGTYVFRLGQCNDYIVQIPKPLREYNIYESSVSLFERLQARVLMMGGSHPFANTDQSSDISSLRNKENIFSLVNQVILREYRDHPLMVLQCRAFGYTPDRPLPSEDVLLSLDRGYVERGRLNLLESMLIKTLEEYNFKTGIVDGSISKAPYQVGFTTSLLYTELSTNKEFALLWFSKASRTGFRQRTEDILQEQQFNAIEIDTVEDDVYQYLLQKTSPGVSSVIPPGLRQQIHFFITTHDIINLYNLINDWSDYKYQRFIDINSKQSFLFVYSSEEKLVLVVNLSPRDSNAVYELPLDERNYSEITKYTISGDAYLEFVNIDENN